jgi:hypothetical protein
VAEVLEGHVVAGCSGLPVVCSGWIETHIHTYMYMLTHIHTYMYMLTHEHTHMNTNTCKTYDESYNTGHIHMQIHILTIHGAPIAPARVAVGCVEFP